MKIAFNTIACSSWTLERVMSFADEVEYDGVELRTFGWGSGGLVCEPALTDDAKIRRLAIDSGTHIMCLATSLRFDQAVFPPVIGQVLPTRNRVQEAGKRFLALADDIECPMIRVFGFGARANEKRSRTVHRIVTQLGEVLDGAQSRQVRIVLENGGSFCTATDLKEIITQCNSPWLGAAYNIAVGARAGESIEQACDCLGARLWSVKLNDIQGTQAVELGHGEIPVERAVRHLAQIQYPGWLVVEWMKHWMPELAPTEGVLRRSQETIRGWIAQSTGSESNESAADLIDRDDITAHAASV